MRLELTIALVSAAVALASAGIAVWGQFPQQRLEATLRRADRIEAR